MDVFGGVDMYSSDPDRIDPPAT
eukprot:COSAG01_NODE_33839_length_557_cov_1.831878_1_plen_22_part_10